MSVADTEEDTPFLVSMSPWTIQGCRPFSVSIQPAVLIRKGRITTQGAIRRNHLALVELVAVEQPGPPQGEEEDQRAQVGHDPHGPVLDEDVGDVVPGPVLLLVLRVQVVEPLHLAVDVVGGQDGQQVGDLEDLGRASRRSLPAADLERARRGSGVGQVVHSASAAAIFIGWYLPSDHAELAAHEEVEGDGRQQDHQRDDRRAAEGLDLVLRGSRCQADTASMISGAGDQGGQDDVGVAPQEDGVGEQRPDVVELRLVGAVVRSCSRPGAASRSWPP